MEKTREIFVVEDSEIIRKMIVNTISNLDGFIARGFANGEALLVALEAKKPALIFVDYFLDSDKKKHITGQTVILMSKKRHPAVPIILMTGTSQKFILESIKRLPIAHFIHKDEDDILDQIEAATIHFSSLD